MSVMNYVSSEIKILAVKHCLIGTESLNQSAARFGVSRSTLQKWLLNYEMFGTEGLCHRAGNHHYSKEIKREAVEAYLSGRMSEEEICKKYQIRSRTQLEKWVSLYNGQKEFRPAGGTRKGTCMAKISEEEKQAAVEFCIAHDRDYALTAERFGFTYQQVYGWVRKYHAAGLNSLREDRECSRELSDWVAENKQLKAVNLELEIEAVLHRKLQQYRHQGRSSPDLSGVRQAAAYQAIKELHEEHRWPVYKLCAAVGVSKAGYYKWLNRAVSQKQTEDEKLAGLITEIYQAQRGIPGYRQMKIILERRYGLKCNLKRIYRLMRVLGLRSVCRKKKRRYQKKTPAEYTAENILNREFSSDRQNEKWVTAITQLKYGSGSKAYLSAVLDLYGRNIVAFSLSRRNNTPLVLDTFEQAFQKYPDAKPLLHSDRGVQYTSRSFRKEMKRAGVCQSMSRVGRCLDNAPMEGFWGILKTEMYYLYHFEDYETLRKTICAYIDFYNNDRYQKKLGCMTPAEFIAASAK